MTRTLNTTLGAYRQADLERMEESELREVRDWAGEAFNRHLAGHGYTNESCEACKYFELLQGAAADLLLSRLRAGSSSPRRRSCGQVGLRL